jgi:hypothetical protein
MALFHSPMSPFASTLSRKDSSLKLWMLSVEPRRLMHESFSLIGEPLCLSDDLPEPDA